MNYDELQAIARDKWNSIHAKKACYVQQVKFSDGRRWRICDQFGIMLGYINI